MNKINKIKILGLLVFGLTMSIAHATEVVEVYKDPNCGCCSKWAKHMEKAGFTVNLHVVNNIMEKREKTGMPAKYASCHIAKVNGYLIEGHVPANDVKRMLEEKPDIIGIAVPGMPFDAPGMDGNTSQPYNTLQIHKDGSSKIYSKH